MQSTLGVHGWAYSFVSIFERIDQLYVLCEYDDGVAYIIDNLGDNYLISEGVFERGIRLTG